MPSYSRYRIVDRSQSVVFDFLAGDLRGIAFKSRAIGEGRWEESVGLAGDQPDGGWRAEMISLERIGATAFPWRADQQDHFWLEAAVADEAGRRSHIVRIRLEAGRVTIERLAWESPQAEPLISSGVISTVGGSYLHGEVAPAGDFTLPGRLSMVRARLGAGTVTGAISQLWIGLRETSAWDFLSTNEPLSRWEPELGTMLNGTVIVSDPSAGPGGLNNAVQAAYAAGEVELFRTTVRDQLQMTQSEPWLHVLGSYRFLARLKVSDVNTAVALELRCSHGGERAISAGRSFYAGAEKGTSYRLVELGDVLIPLSGYREQMLAEEGVANFTLHLLAAWAAGTGSITVDRLIAIPTQQMARVSEGEVTAERSTVLRVLEDERQFCTVEDQLGRFLRGAIPESHRWQYPQLHKWALVIAAEQQSEQVQSDTIEIEIEHVQRHSSVRT